MAPIADSLGHMSAYYMHDIQRAYAGGDESGYFSHGGADANLLDFAEGSKETSVPLKDFLRAVAQDPEGYSAITNAQQAVTTEGMRRAIATREHLDIGDVASLAARPGATIAGTIAEGKAEAIAAADDSKQKAKEYNYNLEDGTKWVARVLKRGVGNLIDHHQLESRIPIAGEFAGWVIDDIEKAVVRNYTHDPAAEAKAIIKSQSDYLDNERGRIAGATKQAFLDAANQAGLDPDDIEVENAADRVRSDVNFGFADGKGR